MKHNCNQYTIELLYNELIIIKSSSHFNLQPWKWEIKLNNEQEEKGRISACAGELAMEDRQKEVSSPVCNTWGASLLNSFQCWSRRENAKSPSEFCEQRSQFLPKKPKTRLLRVKHILNTSWGWVFLSSKTIFCDIGKLLVQVWSR